PLRCSPHPHRARAGSARARVHRRPLLLRAVEPCRHAGHRAAEWAVTRWPAAVAPARGLGLRGSAPPRRRRLVRVPPRLPGGAPCLTSSWREGPCWTAPEPPPAART